MLDDIDDQSVLYDNYVHLNDNDMYINGYHGGLTFTCHFCNLPLTSTTP